MALQRISTATFARQLLANTRHTPLPSLSSRIYAILPSLIPASALAIFPALTGGSIWTDVWESVLRAVPKKKTSHMKKRHRQRAGKALTDMMLTKCSSCGRPKRANILCPYCVQAIKEWWRQPDEVRQ